MLPERFVYIGKYRLQKYEFYLVYLHRKIWSCHKIKISLEKA